MLMVHNFQTCRIRWSLLSGILFCVIATFGAHSAFGETAKRAESGLSNQDVHQLEQIALKIFDAVVQRDMPGLLKFIDSGGIRWGADGEKSYTDVEKDLRSGQGPLYCRIFGCPKSSVKSVRAYFRVVKRSQVKVEVWYFKEASASGAKSANAFYHWQGKPKRFDEEFDPLEFKWDQEAGWKCEGLFED